MGVDKITLPPPVQTTKDRIDLQSGYSGGNIAIYGKKSKVLDEKASTAFLAKLDKQYRELQKSQGNPENGFSPFANNLDAPTRPQVIHGEDGNYYISAQDAPCIPSAIDPNTGETLGERQATGTIIVAVNKEGELKSVKAYAKTDPEAWRQGTAAKVENTKGYLIGYATVGKDGKWVNHIKGEPLPTNPAEIQANPKRLDRIFDKNLIDTKQLPKDGSVLTIGD
jgi:hypothetical protein